MKIILQKSFFSEKEKLLLTYGDFSINSFLYQSGVEALRVTNSKMSFIFIPYKGQQIWHPIVNGTDISMKSTVTEPTASSLYMQTYGGFLYHCGLISMGAPDAEHPHHGEIPNAIYNSAYIGCGQDKKGKYILLGGELEHNTAFLRHYKFLPEIKLYEDGTVFKINVKIENLRSNPLEYMYLAHINFRRFEGAKVLYSGKCTSENIRIYEPPTENMDRKLAVFIDEIKNNPEIINEVGTDNEFYDPELCISLKYMCDENNRAYTLQYTENGACYVSHPTDVLSNGIRWTSRTDDDDSMGIVLPATTDYLNYAGAKQNGKLKIIDGNSSLEFYMEAGWLEPDEAVLVKQKIEEIVK